MEIQNFTKLTREYDYVLYDVKTGAIFFILDFDGEFLCLEKFKPIEEELKALCLKIDDETVTYSFEEYIQPLFEGKQK